jgi:bacteriocin-like protein
MKEKTKTNELNRKASLILRPLDEKELEQVNGGLVQPPDDGCPHCGMLTSL